MREQSKSRLLSLADKNLKYSIEHRITQSNFGEFKIEDSYMLYSLGVDSKDVHLNGVLCLDSVNPELVFNDAKKFFGTRGFGIWIREHKDVQFEKYLQDKGFKPVRTPGAAGMVIHKPFTNVNIPDGYSVKMVQTIEDVSDYADVIQDAFVKSDEVRDEMYNRLDMLASKYVKAHILYDGTTAVGAATTVLSGEIAGIYYLGVKKDGRGKGLGSLLTKIATNEGFKMGAESVILQASLVGESVYKRLGYQLITHYRCYLI